MTGSQLFFVLFIVLGTIFVVWIFARDDEKSCIECKKKCNGFYSVQFPGCCYECYLLKFKDKYPKNNANAVVVKYPVWEPIIPHEPIRVQRVHVEFEDISEDQVSL